MASRKHSKKASLIVYVLAMLIFLSTLVLMVVEKAQKDLIDKATSVDVSSLRIYAYSALNATMAILEEYRSIDGGLYSYDQGWQYPLSDGRIQFPDGVQVEVIVEDECAKLPLVGATSELLIALFEMMDISESEATKMADCLLDWMDTDDSVRFNGAEEDQYTTTGVPKPPNRLMKDFSELKYIDEVSDNLFDEDGNPNENYELFVENVSLENFTNTNVNHISEFLYSVYYDAEEKSFDSSIMNAIKGIGVSVEDETWLTNLNDLRNRGYTEIPVKNVAAESSLLKITIIVRKGFGQYVMSAYYGDEVSVKNIDDLSSRNTTTSTSSAGATANRYSSNTATQQQSSNSTAGFDILRLSEFSYSSY